jgi:endonuclease-3
LKSLSRSPAEHKGRRRKANEDLKRRVEDIFLRLEQDNPNPRCELYYLTPFQLLVSVVLSAQTTDKMVNRCMRPVYDQGFTPQIAVELGAEGLFPLIKSIGFAPTKSKNVAKLAQLLMERHGGEVPRDRKALEALPGVGTKTASVILAELWNEPVLAVDTHVFRVARRLGLHRESTPDKAAVRLMEVIDSHLLPKAHHWLILHGRYTCKARNPQCDRCVISHLCPSAAMT